MQHVWIGNFVPLCDFFKTFTSGQRNTKGRSYYLMSGAPGKELVEFLIYIDYFLPPLYRWIGKIEDIKILLGEYEKFKEVPKYWKYSTKNSDCPSL